MVWFDENSRDVFTERHVFQLRGIADAPAF